MNELLTSLFFFLTHLMIFGITWTILFKGASYFKK